MKKIVSMIYMNVYIFSSMCSSYNMNNEKREENTKQIILRIASKGYVLQVTNDTAVKKIKEMLKDKKPENKYIKIVWAGRPLKDTDTVGSAKIPNDSTVEFFLLGAPSLSN